MRATRECLRTVLVAAALLGGTAHAGDAPRAIDVIENDLVAVDPAVRAKAAAELIDRFPDGAVAVPMLVDLLDDESPDVVAAAAKAIDAMAVAATGPLAEYLANDERWTADGWIATIAGSVAAGTSGEPGWSHFDRSLGPTHVPTADELAVTALFPDIRDAPRVLDAMRRTTDASPVLAAAALSMQGAVALVSHQEAPPSPSEARSRAATKAVVLIATRRGLKAWTGTMLLERLRCADDAVIAGLAAILRHPQLTAAAIACEMPAVSAQRAACRALGAIGPAAAPAAPALLAVSTDENRFVIAEDAADALLRLGKEAEVVATVTPRPGDAGSPKKSFQRMSVCSALAKRRRCVDVLLPLLIAEVEKPNGSSSVLYALADLGPAASDALPALRQRMRGVTVDGERLVHDDRIRYADTMLAIAANDEEAIEFLTSVPKNIEDQAIRSLAKRGAAVPCVIDRVLAYFRRQIASGVWDRGMVEALGRFGAAAEPVAGQLLRHLTPSSRDDVISPRLIVVALGRIGPDAATAVPALTALRDKGDETIRVPAAQALRRIAAKK